MGAVSPLTLLGSVLLPSLFSGGGGQSISAAPWGGFGGVNTAAGPGMLNPLFALARQPASTFTGGIPSARDRAERPQARSENLPALAALVQRGDPWARNTAQARAESAARMAGIDATIRALAEPSQVEPSLGWDQPITRGIRPGRREFWMDPDAFLRSA